MRPDDGMRRGRCRDGTGRAWTGGDHTAVAGMLSTLTSYRLLTRDFDRSLELKAAEAPIARESEYYRANIGSVRSIDDFLADTRVFSYAMRAFGLEEMTFAKGYMRKVLEEGVDRPDAFANKLTDTRFREFAATFNFARDGESAVLKTDAQQGVIDRYVRQALEVSAGEENEGVRLALYFRRTAPEVSSAFEILADPALFKVVQTLLGLPQQLSSAPIELQAKAIESRLDLAEFQDPAAVETMIVRFTAVYDATERPQTDPLLALFNTQPAASVSVDLLTTLQRLRLGG